jgi:hypothetical protein
VAFFFDLGILYVLSEIYSANREYLSGYFQKREGGQSSAGSLSEFVMDKTGCPRKELF